MTTKKNTTPAEALAGARILVAQRQAERHQAQTGEASLIARLERGDDTVTAADLTEAGNAVHRAGILLGAARRAVVPAERAADRFEAANSPTLAEWVRGFIEAESFACGVYGFPVSVVPAIPSGETGPAVYLTQTRATKYDTVGGFASGEVSIRVLVPGGGNDGEQMCATLSRAITGGTNPDRKQANADITGHSEPDGFALNVDLDRVMLAMPFINEKTSDHYVNSFVQGLGGDITKAGRLTERGVVVGGGDAWALVSDIKATATGGLAGQSRAGDLVTRTIDAECVVRGPYDIDALTRKARQAVEMQRGKFVAALGRIESATVQRVRPTEDTHQRRGVVIEARITIASKAA